jgi:hypothetical protein
MFGKNRNDRLCGTQISPMAQLNTDGALCLVFIRFIIGF